MGMPKMDALQWNIVLTWMIERYETCICNYILRSIVRLPSSLQTFCVGDAFNQSLAGVALPSNLQTLRTFGTLSNH